MKHLNKLILSALMAGTFPAMGENLKVENHSFESGTGGYWLNISSAARVDSTDSTDGSKSLLVTPPEGKTVDIVFSGKYTPDTTYRIIVDAKVSGAKPELSAAFMARGDKPIQFYPQTREQKQMAASNPALSGDWQKQQFEFGPIPTVLQGKDVKNFLVYIKVKGTGADGELRLDNIRLEAIRKNNASPQAAVSSERISFELPGTLRIYDRAINFKTIGKIESNEILEVIVSNAFGKQIIQKRGKAGESSLETALSSPDYYQIEAVILNKGKKVFEASTSVVVTTPLPANYYKTEQPAFGVWGGLNPELRRLGGAKWDRQLFFTRFQKDNETGTPPTAEQLKNREPVKIIRCMNILDPFKKMVPLPKEEWDKVKQKLSLEIRKNRGLVDVWETQNEPMVGENFHGSMDDVMDIIRLESEVVRKENPGTPIAGICINPMSGGQYNQYKGYYSKHGISKYIDAIMLHPYIPGAQSPDAAGYVETLNRLQKELREITGKEIPLYISEIGYSTKPGGEVTELQQAAYLARVMILNYSIPSLKACVWHIGLWNDATSRRELDFGLLRPHQKKSPVRVPKPAFAAWAAAGRILYDATLVRELDFGRNIRVWLFKKADDKPLLIAYSLSQKSVEFKLAVNADSVEVTSLFGKNEKIKTEDGVLPLTLTEAPVYVELPNGKISDFSGDRYNTLFTPENLTTPAGATLNFTVKMPENFSGSQYKLSVQSSAPVQIAEQGKNGLWNVKITFPPRMEPGEYDFFFRLEENKNCRFIRQKKITILAPLELENVRPGLSGTEPEILFSVKQNGGTGKGSAVVEILDATGRALSIGKVTAGEKGRLALYNTSYGKPQQYTARFTTPDRFSWTASLPDDLVPVRIPYLKNAFGKAPAEYPAGGVYPVEDGAVSLHAVSGKFDRPTGSFALAYDEKNLYISADIRDQWFKTSPAASLWNSDSLQIGISVAQKDMIRPNNDGIQETAYAEFGIHAGADKPDSWVWASMNLNNMPLHKPVPGLLSKSSFSDGTIRYRIAVPWTTLNIVPKKDMSLGVSITVNDRDEKDRHWVEWYGGIANGKDPAMYGKARLQ